MMNFHKGAALFVGGVLFGSAGFKLLSSKDAKKAYTHMTAAALRVQESVMETVTSVQENAADILASAKEINSLSRGPEARADVPVLLPGKNKHLLLYLNKRRCSKRSVPQKAQSNPRHPHLMAR